MSRTTISVFLVKTAIFYTSIYIYSLIVAFLHHYVKRNKTAPAKRGHLSYLGALSPI
ncbi:hypothetical protein Javan164_0050 [Streptococcus phage Javan164]|nr:hypothetical protein Javan164_0050 [Streptococcus phage Javan164]